MDTKFYSNAPCYVDDIKLHIPTVKEVIGENLKKDIFDTVPEEEYMQVLSLFAQTPTTQISNLDAMGIDFRDVNDFDVFLMLFRSIDSDLLERKASLFFDNICFADMEVVQGPSGRYELRNLLTDAVIDEVAYNKMSKIFCEINCVKKEVMQVETEETKQYLIDRQKRYRKRHENDPYISKFGDYIVGLVNSGKCPYDYDTILDLTIPRFYLSLNSVSKQKQADNLNLGLWTGHLDGKIDPSKLDWLDINH